MANVVDTNQTAVDAPSFDPFAGPSLLATAPSTDPQREIWAASELGDDASLAYNESITLGMKGELDIRALKAALSDLVARHEALRTTVSRDGLTLMISASAELPFERKDLFGLSDVEIENRWHDILEREVTVPFDLLRGPLARVVVVRIGPDEHRVVFTAHHIVCDGWSSAVLVRDWGALYSSRVEGAEAKLWAADGFGAYARQLAGRATDDAAKDDEAYWLKQFQGEIPTLELPLDRPRPPRKTFSSAREDLTLDAALVGDLKRAGAKERSSLFVTMLSGFAVLLARLSGQEDLVIAIPAAGQAEGGHEGLVGHCVNTLPLRVHVNLERAFAALLGDVRTTVLDAFEHQHHTFGSLLRKLPLARDPSRPPLVSVMFNVDRGMAPETIPFHGIHTTVAANPRRSENFELFVNAVELGGEVRLECQYNTDLFDRETIQLRLREYAELLRGVARNVGCAAGDLPILTPAESAELRAWNDATSRPDMRGLRLDDLIEAQVARTPDAPAVEFDGVSLSYCELDARANGLAAELRSLGVKRGALVGLCVDRSNLMMVGLLGILKAGGAYVPLDPGYPRERLKFMVEDSGMRVLVTEEAVRRETPLAVEHVVLVEAASERATPLPQAEDGASPEDVAYAIYTSGSTGKPKGVLVPHRAAANIVLSLSQTPGLTQDDVVLAVTTLSFDIAIAELILPLAVGAKVVLASREVATDGVRLLALMRRAKATFLQATPATWRLLLAAGWEGGEGLKAASGGEPLPRDLAVALTERAGSVWNLYGPTETTVWSTSYEVKSPVRRILVGKPLANTQLYLVDRRMVEVPIGVVGEVLIGGTGVTHGYLNRPETTRERFIRVPAVAGDALLFKTGDLGRMLPDGNLECLGRNDGQVKVRGFRIELGEVESALGKVPGVKAVSVIVREDRPGDVRLVGYVVLAADANPTDTDIRARLKVMLPDYMIPQAIVRLPAMPLTANGKIDRKRLPAPQASDGASSGEFVAPATEAEKQIAEIWQDVLGVGRVSVNDDFFALGGHSLLASQVLARLRRDHGVTLSFRSMFEAPTLAKLAALVDRAPPPSAEALAKEAQIPVRKGAGPAPLSASQRRMWLLEELDPGHALVHNHPAAWRLDGPLNVDLLQASIDALVERHDTLRTNVVRGDDGTPVQVVVAERRIALEIIDLSHLAPEAQERELEVTCDARTTVPFDLAKDILLRLTLFRRSEAAHVLFTLRHNIIWDGWSFDIFLSDLAAVYGALARGEPNPLKPLPICYADFAVWQSEWLAGEGAKGQAEFWRSRLKDAPPPLELPTDRPRLASRSHAGSNEGIHIPHETDLALTAFARERGATLFMVVFAAFNVLIHRQTGETDLVVGTPVRARTRPELEGIIGPFVNTVVLRTKMTPEMTFVELLDRVRDATLDAFTHQEFPLELLGENSPVVRAMFSLQDARNRPPLLGDVRVSQWHVQPPAAGSDIMLWMMQGRSDLFAMLNYSTDLFDSATAKRFLEELRLLLAEVLRDPKQAIGKMTVLPPEERELLLKFGKGSKTSAKSSVAAMVSERARAAPDEPALTCDGRLTSWGALPRRVNRIARELHSRSVGAGARVAVRLARGDDWALAVLAVLACGASIALAGEAATLTLDELDEGRLALHSDEELPPPEGQTLAYANVSQGALAAALEAFAGATNVAKGGIALVHPDNGSIGALTRLLVALAAGARVVVEPEPSDAKALRAALTKHSVSFYAAPAGAFRTLLAGGWEGGAGFTAVVIGPSNASLAERLSVKVGAAFSSYVPWAMPHIVSVHRLTPKDESYILGGPLGDLELRVEDSAGELAPVGAHGEIVLCSASGERTRTGDRGRWLCSGELIYVGRRDGRVSIRDAVVNRHEVAAELARHPAVEEAFVAVREDRIGEPRLVAYISTRQGVAFTETELREHLRPRFGDVGLPQVFVEQERLPRDRNGAIAEERLLSPYASGATEGHVPPRTESERVVASAWAEALGPVRIGVYDKFFDLGGHSLLCFQVVARIMEKTGTRISPRLMLLGSLEQVAAELDGAKIARDAPATTATAPAAKAEGTGGRRLLDRLKAFVTG